MRIPYQKASSTFMASTTSKAKMSRNKILKCNSILLFRSGSRSRTAEWGSNPDCCLTIVAEYSPGDSWEQEVCFGFESLFLIETVFC